MASREMAPTVRSYAQLKAANNSTPVKSLLRSALSSKRRAEDADLDSQGDETPDPRAKRAKTVIFSPHNEIRIIMPPTEPQEPLDDIKQSVKRALEEHIRPGGDDTRYDGLKEIFSKSTRKNKKADNDNMKAYLLALTSCTSLMGKNCSSLVKAILQSEWLGREWAYVRIYVDFMANLASAQAVYLSDVLNMVANFLLGVKLSSGRLTDCDDLNRPQLMSRVHFALKYLLRLFPSAPGTLSPILKRNFPFIDSNTKTHMTYVHNLIRILEYAPELKSDILALITEKLVALDVQTMADMGVGENDITEAIEFAVDSGGPDVDSDSDNSNSDSESDSDDDQLADPRGRKLDRCQENVWTQDAILDLLFELYTPYFEDPESTTAVSMFDTLLSHFRNIILPTYRSRHTQFLLFHFAQKSEHLVDTFAGECVDLAFKSGRPAVLKQSAASFLASFVARGKHVQPHVVRDVFHYIGVNLDIIRAENELSCRGPDLQRYGTFYATTQALLYIFCFRWRDLIIPSGGLQYDAEGNEIDVEHDEEEIAEQLGDGTLMWRHGVKDLLHRTINSKLNPLKICAPNIVREFARTAHSLQFMSVWTLIELNKKIRLSQYGAGNVEALRDAMCGQGKDQKKAEAWYQLDEYFPFDPYVLPRSARWVVDDYLGYKEVPGAVELEDTSEDEDDDEDDEDEEEDSDDEEETATEEEK